ncbi:MAG: SDR family NAD(P)-dependent oxidoreductase [Pseudomonadota bacterium]
MSKSILITGCSSGIGEHAAKSLHKRGWRVFATCRRQEDCDRLEADGLESFVLDYDSEQSVREGAAEALKRTGGTLNALFNNGAYGIPGLVEDVPRDAMRAIYETNLFGQWQLINEVLPAMRAQGHGRIVNNSSVLGFAALRARGAYNSSKFALEGLTDTLRVELGVLGDKNIHVCLIEPGPITTMIREKSIPPFEKWIDVEGSHHTKFYKKVLIPRLYDNSGTPDRFELPCQAVTDKLLHALNAANPKPRYYVTTPTHVMGFLKRILPTRAFDAVLKKA